MGTERTITDVFHDIVANIQEIVRSEVRLAKTEVQVEVGKVKYAGVLAAVGALTGTFAVGFLLLSAVYALSYVMPNWAAALVVGLLLVVICGTVVAASVRRFRQVHAKPERTVATMKENVEWVHQHTR